MICVGRRRRAVSMRVYDRYRREGADLNNRLLDSEFFEAAMEKAVAAAGVVGRTGRMRFRTEMELHATMDAALCDFRSDEGRTPVQAYMDDVGPSSKLERVMLEARIEARTSLFRAEECDASKCTVRMSDLLRGGRGVTIRDRGLSATLLEGHSVFFRLYRFPELCMTSGVSFAFAGDSVPTLVRRYRRMRADPGRRGPASRFALFFRMNRRHGRPILETSGIGGG